MITYVFECESCENHLEVEQSITENLPERHKCPACGKPKLKRLLFAPHFYNKPGDGEISVGLLAERNSQSFSDSHKKEIMEKNRTGPTPQKKEGANFWETTPGKMKQIAKMNNQQQTKYIETGET